MATLVSTFPIRRFLIDRLNELGEDKNVTVLSVNSEVGDGGATGTIDTVGEDFLMMTITQSGLRRGERVIKPLANVTDIILPTQKKES